MNTTAAKVETKKGTGHQLLQASWRKITIGTSKSMKNFLDIIDDKSFFIRMGPHVTEALERVILADCETNIELFCISNADLGFKHGANFEWTCNRISNLGFDFVPSETGLLLRREYTDQAVGKNVFIAMEPILISGVPYVFSLEAHHSGYWLNLQVVDPYHVFSASTYFVCQKKIKPWKKMKKEYESRIHDD
jgi:hypothetical protein